MVDGGDSTRRCYQFGPFRLDTAQQQLYKDDQPLELPRRLVRALQLLIENHGKDLDKAYLMEQLWPNTVVEEHNLPVIISMLRKVLGDDLGHKKYILTNPRRGYRFVAEVTELDPSEPAPPAAHEAASLTASASAVDQYLPARRRFSRQHWFRLLWMSAAACLLLLAVLVGLHRWNQHNVTQSIAVLPFQPLGAEHDDGYLGLEMADALTARLRSIRHLVVRPTTEVARYQNTTDDPLSLGKQLQVVSLLEGMFQKTGERLWLRVKLVRVKDGTTLWTQEYRGRFTEILALQDQIAQQATDILALKLDKVEQLNLYRQYSTSSDAYRLYLAARTFCSESAVEPRTLEKGIAYFRQAIEKDPRFALAYASLAECEVQLATQFSQQERLPQAELSAQRALEIDGTLQEAYLSLAFAKVYYDWDFPGAESAFRKGIDLRSDRADAHIAYAQFLTTQGRFREAEFAARQAIEAAPYSWDANKVLTYVYFFGHRYQEAAERWEKEVELSLSETPWYLAWIDTRQGRPISMLEDLKQAETTAVNKGYYTAELAYVYALQGMQAQAEAYLQKSVHSPQPVISDYDISLIYDALGDKDRAFEFLERAKAKHASEIVYAKVDPRLDELRSDPRFAALLHSIHLSP